MKHTLAEALTSSERMHGWISDQMKEMEPPLRKAFDFVAQSPMSGKEHFFQLLLSWWVESELGREGTQSLWAVKGEPPAIKLQGSYDKWPDLAVVGTDTIYWWELKWIDNPDKFFRFVADTVMLQAMNPEATADGYARTKTPGHQLKALLDAPGGPGLRPEQIKDLNHAGIGLAICTEDRLVSQSQLFERIRKKENLIKQFPEALENNELVRTLVSELQASEDAFQKAWFVEMLAADPNRPIGLIAWRQGIGLKR